MKIFQIGFNRCGTLSLHEFLKIMVFNQFIVILEKLHLPLKKVYRMEKQKNY